MKTLSGTALNSFAETLLGTEILILANVVIAAAGREIAEADTEMNRSVAMPSPVKSEDT